MDDEDDLKSLGWDAINDALREVYGTQEPKHWGTVLPYALGGKDPLTGISAYDVPGYPDIWHFVTYGFSELYEKESDDLSTSGFGFELTFRLRTNDVDADATWVFNFLQNLARYVFETGRVFGPGHTIPLNGPIRSDSQTLIQCAAFTLDSSLGEIVTPNGSVEFVQIVGLTVDEMDAVLGWNTQAFVNLMRETNPDLVTDLERVSLLNDRSFREAVEKRSYEEGASASEMSCNDVSYASRPGEKCVINLPAFLIRDLLHRLSGRIPFGRDFALRGTDSLVIFNRDDTVGWQQESDHLSVQLDGGAFGALRQTVRPKAGDYSIPQLEGIVFRVHKTEIKDTEGNVRDVIG